MDRLACLVRLVEQGVREVGTGEVETGVFGIVMETGESGFRMATEFDWNEEKILGEM